LWLSQRAPIVTLHSGRVVVGVGVVVVGAADVGGNVVGAAVVGAAVVGGAVVGAADVGGAVDGGNVVSWHDSKLGSLGPLIHPSATSSVSQVLTKKH